MTVHRSRPGALEARGITLPLVQSDQHIESEMFLHKCAPGCGLQILLEFRGTNSIGQGEVRFQTPGFPLRCVEHSP